MSRSFSITPDAITPDDRAAFAALYHLAGPTILSRVGFMLMGLMDTIVVGRYSSAQLGFMMLAQSLFWVPAVTSMGLLMGIQVKTAHFLGAEDHHRIGAVFQRGITYALALGFGFMALLLVVGCSFLGFVTTPEMARGAQIPIVLFTLGMPSFLVATACTQFLEALGRTREVLVGTLLANGLNIVLLLAFVPGQIHILGWTPSGATGAACATLIARTLQAAGLVVYVLTLRQTKPYGLLDRQPADHQGAVEQRHVGYATGAAYFIEVGAFAGMTLFAGRFGATAVASWAIVLNFAAVVFMVPMGISAGCSVLVGKAFGAGDREGVARFGRISFMTAGAFMGLVVITVLIGASLIAGVYTQDVTLLPTVRLGLLLSCLFFIPDGLQVVAAQALRARHDVMAPTIIHYVSYGLIMLPLGFVLCLTLRLGVPGLIGAVTVASLMSGTFQTARFLWLDRKIAEDSA